MTVERVLALTQQIAPERQAVGFELGVDGVFRRWDQDRQVCSLLSIIEYSRPWWGRYTGEIGFYAPGLRALFGLSLSSGPRPSDADMSGFFFRFETLCLWEQTGWTVGDAQEEADVGSLFNELIRTNVDNRLAHLSTLEGWPGHLRALLAEGNKGRPSNHLRMLAWVLLQLRSSSKEDCELALRELRARAGRRHAVHVGSLERVFLERFGSAARA